MRDGGKQWGDLLIGADGIWSEVRKHLLGDTPATYSGYTCYTGIADFVCYDIDTVGYRVFLGRGLFVVTCDMGGGKMQWYACHEEAAGGKDAKGEQKKRLLSIFGKWYVPSPVTELNLSKCARFSVSHWIICRTNLVTDVIAATPEDEILRRDVFDRPPIFEWSKGHVALLGDSAHAMQPNMGQGGCMAIEDAYELGKLIGDAIPHAREQSVAAGESEAFHLDIPRFLKAYQGERLVRVSAVHGMARSAAIAASWYNAYLGEQFHLEDKIKIVHPGRVLVQLLLGVSMPLVLDWLLVGNNGSLEDSDRVQNCSLKDQPHSFGEKEWDRLMTDDEALLSASHALWVLVTPAKVCLFPSLRVNISTCCSTVLFLIVIVHGNVQKQKSFCGAG